MSKIKVSIIIPTLNSAQVLDKCLASVRAHKSKYDYEIIVVDAGSTDKTKELAEKYADKFLRGLPNRMNRNIGIQHAKGEIICFTDSDCIVPEDWIDSLVDGLSRLNKTDPSIVSVGSGNDPLLVDATIEEEAVAKTMRSPFVAFGARNVTNYKKERQVQHNPTLNSAYFKWAILEGGGFREESYSFPEEIDLDAKLAKKGYKAYYMPRPKVLHKHRSTAESFYAQMKHYGRARINVNKENPEIWRFYHLGPLILYLMLYSPFFFVPFTMALFNAIYISWKGKNCKLFNNIFKLTVGFYKSYGSGEASVLFRKDQ
jgi:glycosyltransferase involved in cell wall biosynthesis